MNTSKTNKWMYVMVVTAVCSATSMNAMIPNAVPDMVRRTTEERVKKAPANSSVSTGTVKTEKPKQVVTTPSSNMKSAIYASAAATAAWVVKKVVTRR